MPVAAATYPRDAHERRDPRIKEIFESQSERCQPELMAYFLRVDPDYAVENDAKSAVAPLLPGHPAAAGERMIQTKECRYIDHAEVERQK